MVTPVSPRHHQHWVRRVQLNFNLQKFQLGVGEGLDIFIAEDLVQGLWNHEFQRFLYQSGAAQMAFYY